MQMAGPSGGAAAPYRPTVRRRHPSEYGEGLGYKSEKLANLLKRGVSPAKPHALLCLNDRESALHDSALCA